jgi:Ca-activated chloride channel family protein
VSVQELFAWPEGLPVLLAVPLAWLLLHVLDRARAARLIREAGARGRALASDLGVRQRRGRRRLAVAGLLLALLAVLQPVWGEGIRAVEQRGVDILVCLDVSRSMLARDVDPSRLESARREIRALASRVRGDRLGLVLFAGEARLTVPLTQDAVAFADLAAQASPLGVRRGGTDLGAALSEALRALGEASGEHEAVVILTDGEDLEERGRTVARQCRERGVVVHCLGFGSTRGSKIAVGESGGERFLRDRSGQEVVSAMDPVSLREIAETAGGVFVDASDRPLVLVRLYEDRILPMARKSFDAEGRRERKNRFQWPLLAALGLWILELCLTDRRRR